MQVVRFILKYAKAVTVASLLVAILGVVYGMGVFPHLSSSSADISALHSDARTARDLTDETFASNKPAAIVLVTGQAGQTVDSTEFKVAALDVQRRIEQAGGTVTGYYDTRADNLVSKDRTQTSLFVSMVGDDEQVYRALRTVADNTASTVVKVDVGGGAAIKHEINQQVEHDLRVAELVSLPILAILLFAIFRSPLAAALPLVLGGVSIVGAMALTRLLTHVVSIEQYAINVITILGLGLAIDYSLLIVSRFREELQHHTIEIAIERTLQTAGRTIIFSGLTVLVSLASLAFFDVELLRSVGIGGGAVVFVALLTALVILPALLALFGKYIDFWRIVIVWPRARGESKEPHGWRRLVTGVVHRPGVSILGVLAVIVGLGWPLYQIHFQGEDWRSLPVGSSSAFVARSMTENFTGKTAPIEIVVKADETLQSKAGIETIAQYTTELQQISGVTKVDSITSLTQGAMSTEQLAAVYTSQLVPPAVSAAASQTLSGSVARFAVYTSDDDSYAASNIDLVGRIKAVAFPGGVSYVGGPAALQYDLLTSMKHSLPVVLGVMVGIMLVLFIVLLRSILLPVATVIINSFALLASFGLMVWIFQDGNSFGFLQPTGGLSVTVPGLVFGIAFGLSMDYSAFLFARMREEYDKTGDSKQAVVEGVRLTGPIITQAAVLLIVVVAAFMLSGIAMLQQIGIGLTVSLFVDAFIVRIFLVPAVMVLFGRASWWAPKWLARWKLSH